MSHYLIAPDGWGDLTIWATEGSRFAAVARQCEVTAEAWALMVAGMGVRA
jgi:hypothetical protein